jgi:negative regulator of sigma E activity
MGFSDDVLAARFAVVLPETPRIEGRPTRVLEIRARNGGGLREKRWVDVQTGRSLRMEQFAVSGKKIRQVELRRIVLPYTAASDLFKPRFPPKVRVIAASAERSPDAERAAARLQLPTRFGDFQVRSVVRPRTTGEATHQVLYSDGIYALSVFVSPENGSARPHGDDWDEVTLSPSVIGYSHDADEQGRSAIAWLRGGHRYVAVGRLPLPLLLRTTRELVTTAVSRASRAQGK